VLDAEVFYSISEARIISGRGSVKPTV
jgi:hypothetical protein